MKKITFIIFSLCLFSLQNLHAQPSPTTPRVVSLNDAVMYEIFVRNFSPQGTFSAIIPRLRNIKSLGVNIIWLMPVQPSGKENKKGTYGSPYAIQDYYAIDPAAGTPANFQQLIDSIHALGMNIIIDLVANHTAWDNLWVKQHPDWYTHDSTGKIVPPVADWTDVADLNYDNKDLRKEMINVMKFWVQKYNIDGYRCDAAEMVPDDFWKDAITQVSQLRPVLMLAEGAKPQLYADGFDMTYGWDVYGTMKKIWQGKTTAWALDSALQREKTQYGSNYHPIRFITDHDENSWDNVPEKVFMTADGAKAAFITMMTLPGIPFLYNGQEVNYPTRINLFEKYSIDWSANPQTVKFYSSALQFYRKSNVLEKGSLIILKPMDNHVLVYTRNLAQDQLLVIVNTSDTTQTVSVPATWQKKNTEDVLSKNNILLKAQLPLKAYEYHILMMKK
jgi:glycosidase